MRLLFLLPIFLCCTLPPLSAHATAQCIPSARQLILELQPFAEQIAGKPLTITLPRNVVLFWISPNGVSEEQATAHVFGTSIQIHKGFCLKDDAVKAAIIAHELGHIIEGESNQTSPWIMAEKWADRITEIRATRHAIDIFRRSGRDPTAFRREYEPRHLEKAGLK